MEPKEAARTECRKYDPNLPWGIYHFILTCVDCAKSNPEDREFIWKAEDQEYFRSKNFFKPPQRCKAHHRKFKKEKQLRDQNREATATRLTD